MMCSFSSNSAKNKWTLVKATWINSRLLLFFLFFLSLTILFYKMYVVQMLSFLLSSKLVNAVKTSITDWLCLHFEIQFTSKVLWTHSLVIAFRIVNLIFFLPLYYQIIFSPKQRVKKVSNYTGKIDLLSKTMISNVNKLLPNYHVSFKYWTNPFGFVPCLLISVYQKY